MPLPPFQNLLDEHARGVHRFLVSRVGATDADDLFQETFIAALRAYPSLAHHTNLQGWLMTIAHRKALDLHRARRRTPVPVGDAAGGPDDAAPPAGGDAVWTRVDALPPRQRAAVALRFACDLSYAEIASVAGGSEQ